MARATTDNKPKKYVREGIPCSPESLAEWEKTWKDMDESFKLLEKKGRSKRK